MIWIFVSMIVNFSFDWNDTEITYKCHVTNWSLTFVSDAAVKQVVWSKIYLNQSISNKCDAIYRNSCSKKLPLWVANYLAITSLLSSFQIDACIVVMTALCFSSFVVMMPQMMMLLTKQRTDPHSLAVVYIWFVCSQYIL